MALADNTDGIVYAVDPWEDFYPAADGTKSRLRCDVFREFNQNLAQHINCGKVVVIRGRFERSRLPPISPDFVFIDGDHRAEVVRKDINLALDILAPGGLLAGHDYGEDDWPGVAHAVGEEFKGRQRVVGGTTLWFVMP